MNNGTLVEFPCQFPIKAFGHGGTDLDTRVVEIIRKHVPDLHEGAVRRRPSSGGKHTAVTVTIKATSLVQLNAIYQDLGDCADVIMTL